MKTTTKIALALALLAGVNGAQAQIINAQPGKALIFSSVATAAGWGDVTYQWYRDGQPIPGATDTVYTLPGNLAHGQYVEFKRGAVSSICPGEMLFSNIFLVTFCALKLNGLCWAMENIDDFRTFAARPDMVTQNYKWNYIGDNSATWTINPCPTGWQLPTQAEFQALINAGYSLAGINTRGNLVEGYFFGPNSTTCSLPNNMSGCIFLRNTAHWTGTQSNASDGIALTMGNPSNFYSAPKFGTASIRCVQ